MQALFVSLLKTQSCLPKTGYHMMKYFEYFVSLPRFQSNYSNFYLNRQESPQSQAIVPFLELVGWAFFV